MKTTPTIRCDEWKDIRSSAKGNLQPFLSAQQSKSSQDRKSAQAVNKLSSARLFHPLKKKMKKGIIL